MKIAKELGKSLEEVFEFSVLEINLWTAYFKLEQEAIKNATDKHRHSSKR